MGGAWVGGDEKEIINASFHTVLAHEISEGRDYSFYNYPISDLQWRAQRPPGYALFFAGLLTVFGASTTGILLVHALVGAVLIVLAYWIGHKWFGYVAALLSALGVALYPYYILNDMALTDRLLFNVSLAVCALVGSFLAERKTIGWVVLMGGVLGVTTFVRGTAVVLVPFIMLWIVLWGYGKQWSSIRNLKMSLTFGVVFMLVLTPWFVRNWVVIGTPTFSTNGGFTAWVGNNPYLDDLGFPAASSESPLFYMLAAMSEEEKALWVSMPEKDWNAYFNQKVWAFIRAHPWEFGENLLRKFYAFWGPTFNPVYYCTFTEIPEHATPEELAVLNGYRYYKQPPKSYWMKNLLHMVSYVPIMILAALGFRYWRRLPGIEVVGFMFVGICGVHVLTVSQTMYRTPLDFFIIILAAGSVTCLKPHWFRSIECH